MADQQHTGNSGNFAEDRAKASRAGHTGGQHSSGNFANNPSRAAEAGRKGGQASHGGGHPVQGGQPNETRDADASRAMGSFVQDGEMTSDAGGESAQTSAGEESAQTSHRS